MKRVVYCRRICMSFSYLCIIPFSYTKIIHSFSQKVLFLADGLVNLCTLTLRRFTDSFILNTSRHVFSSYSSTTTKVLVDMLLAITIIFKIPLPLCIICLLPCH